MIPQTVSLCVIAYNEENNLPDVLRDLHNQTFPHDKTEIVLVDGGSKDRTKAIMLEFAQKYQAEYIGIRVLDNPRKIQASGWNVAIKAASCDAIIRIDAHTKIPKEFAALNMRNLQNGEMISGGRRPCLAQNEKGWTKTLLAVENSLFGSSIGAGRRSEEKQYVNSLFHAAYNREVFDKCGLFDEGLLRTEDNELHYRMGQKGYKFLLDPEIISYQYARSDLKGMIKQKYGNGYWIGTTLKICSGCISLYHLVPAVFILGIIFTTVLAGVGIWQLAAAMWGLYLLFSIISGAAGAKGTGFRYQMLIMPFLFLILHLSYGIGTFVGLIKGKKYVTPSDLT